MFHSVVGVVLPEHAERAAHQRVAAEQPRQRRLAQDREREVGQRAERDERDLAGPPARLVEDDVDRVAVARAARVGGGSSAWPRPCGPCVSGVVSSGRTSGTSRPSATSTSVRPASSRMARVLIATCRASMLPDDAGRGDEVGVGRGDGVEEGEAVVDPGVDVEDEGVRPVITARC